jgi:hypothetical protein
VGFEGDDAGGAYVGVDAGCHESLATMMSSEIGERTVMSVGQRGLLLDL